MSSRSPRSRSPARSASRSPKRSPVRRSGSKSPSPRRKSGSRSLSPRRHSPRRSGSYSRKSSRSYSSGSRSPKRHSRSPSPKRRGVQDRENVSPSSVIGIFGLSPRTREDDLKAEFEKFGDLENVTIIYDRRTGDSKRFGFIYFKSVDDAIKAKEGLKGLVLHGKEVRIDYSVTKRAYSPTPGRYMGKVTPPPDRRPYAYGGDRYGGGGSYGGSYGGGYSRGYGGGGYDRYADRGYSYGDRVYDRGYGGGYGGGYDRGYDRGGYDRGYDRDYDRSFDRGGYDRGYDRGHERSRSPRREYDDRR